MHRELWPPAAGVGEEAADGDLMQGDGVLLRRDGVLMRGDDLRRAGI
jgi:hypothetical protein